MILSSDVGDADVLRMIQHEILKQRQPDTAKSHLQIQPMKRVHQEELVNAFLALYHKSLTATQMETLLDKVCDKGLGASMIS